MGCAQVIRLVWCAALMVMAAASSAQTEVDHFPALYDVAGVAENDVLNVRAAPNSGSEVLGSLAHNAENIEIVRSDPSGTWGLVNIGERAGWISLAFVSRRTNNRPGQFAEDARCFGTEPFWSADLSPNEAIFQSPDALPLTFVETSALQSRNRIDRHTRVYEHPLGGMVATLRAAACSDGMSDRAYGWEVDVLLVVAGDGNAQMFSGCCSLAH